MTEPRSPAEHCALYGHYRDERRVDYCATCGAPVFAVDETRLTRNAARCLHCGDIIESVHRHDFRWCSCGAVAVDGGLSYSKRLWPSGDPADHFEDLNERGNG